jgi:hypothetical protein
MITLERLMGRMVPIQVAPTPHRMGIRISTRTLTTMASLMGMVSSMGIHMRRHHTVLMIRHLCLSRLELTLDLDLGLTSRI